MRLIFDDLPAELLAVEFAVLIALFAYYVWRVRFAHIDGYEFYQTFLPDTVLSPDSRYWDLI
jgi:hypothetical protein